MKQYFKHAKLEFKSLKKPRNHSDLNATSIQIIGGGYLQPISTLHIESKNLIKSLLLNKANTDAKAAATAAGTA